jgi:hypothetical protein
MVTLLQSAVAALQLGPAWRAAIEDGPPAQLRRREQARLALWCAARAERFLAPEDRARGQHLLQAARRRLDGDAAEQASADAILQKELPTYGMTSRLALGAIELAGAAARRALDRDQRAPGRIVRGAVSRVARAVATLKNQEENMLFLMELSRELWRLELCGAVSRRLPDGAQRIRALVYRGHDGARPRVWVARLDDAWAVLVRADRGRFSVGARDEVAALVPDRWFAEATRAILSARD